MCFPPSVPCERPPLNFPLPPPPPLVFELGVMAWGGGAAPPTWKCGNPCFNNELIRALAWIPGLALNLSLHVAVNISFTATLPPLRSNTCSKSSKYAACETGMCCNKDLQHYSYEKNLLYHCKRWEAPKTTPGFYWILPDMVEGLFSHHLMEKSIQYKVFTPLN